MPGQANHGGAPGHVRLIPVLDSRAAAERRHPQAPAADQFPDGGDGGRTPQVDRQRPLILAPGAAVRQFGITSREPDGRRRLGPGPLGAAGMVE